MATKAPALTAGEEEQIIKTRFLHQVSVARGEPPFKRLTKRFIQLCEEAEKGNADAIHRAHEGLVREIAMMELQADKQKAILLANQREQRSYQDKQKEMANQIEQAKSDIQAKKAELEHARLVRQHNEEYEVLRQVVVRTPARAATQKEIDKVQADIAKITAEGNKTAATMQRRRQQFALLLHLIDELQRAIDEPEELAGEAADQPGGPQAMDVDPAGETT